MECEYICNIAWFKLSEASLKNEREKSLLVCRLISHSISSPSFQHQLLGDLQIALGETHEGKKTFEKALALAHEEQDLNAICILKQRLEKKFIYKDMCLTNPTGYKSLTEKTI